MKVVKKVFYFFALIVSLAAAVLIGTAIMQLGMMVFSDITGIAIPEVTLLGMSGTLGVGVAGVILAGFIHKKKNWDFIRRGQTFHLGKAMLYGILTVCICRFIYSVLSATLFSSWLILEATDSGMEETLLMRFISGVVLAPILEELLFRKVFYSMLRRKYNMAVSVIINAVIFALIHGYQLQGFLSCLLAGVIFALLYERTGIVWYSIIAHMLSNLQAMIGTLLEQQSISLWGTPLVYEVNGYSTYHMVLFLAACVVSIVIIKILRREDAYVSDTGSR